MKLRLTRQQRAYQEQVLEKHGLTNIFLPSSKLVDELASACEYERQKHSMLLDEIVELKSKSLWRIFRERYL